MQLPTAGHGLGVYRQARVRTTIAAALVLTVPFGIFYLLLDRFVLQRHEGLHHPTNEFWVASAVVGVALSVGFGQFVSSHILKLAVGLDKALYAVEQRERERDSAQHELMQKLEQERELIKQKLQFQSRLADYEKYAALAKLALGAAHEINNPLLGILSHLELELKRPANDEERIEIERCIAGVKRISSTIRSLLNYARPGPLQLTRVSLDRLINDSVAFFRTQPLFRTVDIEKSVAPGLPLVTADANQLSQIIANLLVNSAQAMTGPGKVTISARLLRDDQVEVSVADNGSGIPPDVLPHVCEPFFTTKRGKGTGLGLSITESYLHTHGGELAIESTIGRGTVVRFTLPITAPVRAAAQAEVVF